jgi:hypothetical protein
MRVRTVGELREVLARHDDADRIEWAYDGSKECCDGHIHDITEIWGCEATVERSGAGVEVMLTGGEP